MYKILFISTVMIVFVPLQAFVAGRIFNTCVLHVMDFIIWIGLQTVYQWQQQQ